MKEIIYSEEMWELILKLMLKLVHRKYPNAVSSSISDDSLADIAGTNQVCLLCDYYVTYPFGNTDGGRYAAFKHDYVHIKEHNLLPFI